MDALSEWIAGLFSVTSAALGLVFLGGATILRFHGDRSASTTFGMARGSVYLVEAAFVAWILLSSNRNHMAILGLGVAVFIGGQALLTTLARRLGDGPNVDADS